MLRTGGQERIERVTERKRNEGRIKGRIERMR